ncbi:MAG: hypothetical protein DI585_00300 [Pseudomonas fluorescens]|nr:MAG: hypothetical protein DI585_00300 [Pseudomonas fluorescens]
MAITFNTNLAALGAQRNISNSSNAASSSLNKLSSGSRIPTAKDDAAGLAVGSKLKSEIAGLTQAANNAGQATSLLQIADGALSTIGDVLQRMKTLAVQSSSGQLDDASRSLLNQEFTNLKSEIDRVAGITNFNGTKLLSGTTTTTGAATALGNANNFVQVADGFESFKFGENAVAGAVKIGYVAATRTLTATNVATGVSQSMVLDGAPILEDAPVKVNFSMLDMEVTLNEDFSKSTNITGVNTATPAGGTLAITAGTITVSNLVQNADNPVDFTAIAASTVTWTVTDTGAATATITIDGQAFNSVTTTDLESTGAKSVVLADANGNSFTLGFTVGTAADDSETALTMNLVEFGQYVGVNSTNTVTKDFSFKVGTGVTANDNIAFSVNAANTKALALDTNTISTAANADAAIGAVNAAISAIASRRAEVGASQSRLEFAANSISVSIENTSAAASAIMDVDVSAEITTFTNKNVLMQAGISLLGQANQQPALLLRLLQ